MRIRKHINFRRFVVVIYVGFFLVFLATGLRPADAVTYDLDGTLFIPSINLKSDVARLTVENHKLNTPDTIVGSYSRADNKTLLIGHSTTVFVDLDDLRVGEDIFYHDKSYSIVDMVVMDKTDISMNELLEESDEDTLMIMTCAGELLEGGDATHRLIVTAVAI